MNDGQKASSPHGYPNDKSPHRQANDTARSTLHAHRLALLLKQFQNESRATTGETPLLVQMREELEEALNDSQ